VEVEPLMEPKKVNPRDITSSISCRSPNSGRATKFLPLLIGMLFPPGGLHEAIWKISNEQTRWTHLGKNSLIMEQLA
jgi:hypothetical protein